MSKNIADMVKRHNAEIEAIIRKHIRREGDLQGRALLSIRREMSREIREACERHRLELAGDKK